ncbi:MAG: tellurite resistance TerB family protein [Pseudomonadota bacterium]
MSLFSRLRGGRGGSQHSIAQAVMTPAIITLLADGKIYDAEIRQLSMTCSVSPLFRGFDAQDFGRAVAAVGTSIDAKGSNATLAEAAAMLSPELCESAFCLAALVASSDGNVDATEVDALTSIARAMQIQIDQVDKILEVVMMLQRHSNG